MTSPQEGRYTKIAAIAGVIALVIAFLAWIHPFAPRSDASAADAGRATKTSESSAQPPGSNHLDPPLHPQNSADSHTSDSGQTPPAGVSDAGLTNGGEGGAQFHTDQIDPAKPTRVCSAPEVATLRPGAPATVASGLAVLSVKTAQEGSEPYLSLSIASDRDTLAKSVLGAPVRYRFATSRGEYFVNVTDADLATGAMTIQVGCEAKEKRP
ncbi:MAG: hypothetical protein ACRDRL_17005 [Sciscionella sp.]